MWYTYFQVGDFMGRKSDYSVLHESQKREIPLDLAKSKIGKEVMTPSDFAPILSDILSVPFDEKTVRNYFKAICNKSDGLLSVDDFKTGKNRAYEFMPSYNSILLVLMATNYFDGRKNDNRISTREQLYKQLICNINNDELLSEEDRKTIKSHPSYINAELESGLSERINDELIPIIGELYCVDTTIRYRIMCTFWEFLINFRKQLRTIDAKLSADKLLFSHTQWNASKKENAAEIMAFQAETLDDFLIALIAIKRQEEEFQYIVNSEMLSYPLLALANKLFC